jgi:hypothetical protein
VKKHHRYDQALAMALKIVEDERCQQCGLPIWIAHSEDARIEFELDHVVCYACEFEGTETSKKTYKQKKGHTPYVRPILDTLEGEPEVWPTRREHIKKQIENAMAAKANKK